MRWEIVREPTLQDLVFGSAHYRLRPGHGSFLPDGMVVIVTAVWPHRNVVECFAHGCDYASAVRVPLDSLEVMENSP